jgi:hypothetical protein
MIIMLHARQEKIKPVAVLHDVRREVSEILNKPFTEKIDHQIFRPDQKILALWAADCAERVLPYFEDKYPKDRRPRIAIDTCRDWARTGVFHMAVIRKASLGSHAAAKVAKQDDAKYAARAAGQAVGTAHVVTHSLGSSTYAIRAFEAHSGNAEAGLVKEREWQMQRLREYSKLNSAQKIK